MANTAKDIIIYPRRSSTTDDPTMVFCANDDVISANIVLTILTKSNGTLVFTANADTNANTETGNMLSVANNYTDNSVFVVYDSVGFSALSVAANGEVFTENTRPALTTIAFVIDGGGSALTMGTKGSLEVPFTADIIRWTILLSPSGSANIDLWCRDYSTVAPSQANSMTGNLGMTVSSAVANQSTAMGNWRGTRINAGNVITYNVQSATTATKATISLFCKKAG